MNKVMGYKTIYEGCENGINYVIGTIGELLQSHDLRWSDYDRELWCFLPEYRKAWYGKTLEEVTEYMKKELA
jgi:hypothetical protein